jgi:hypothetical protein
MKKKRTACIVYGFPFAPIKSRARTSANKSFVFVKMLNIEGKEVHIIDHRPEIIRLVLEYRVHRDQARYTRLTDAYRTPAKIVLAQEGNIFIVNIYDYGEAKGNRVFPPYDAPGEESKIMEAVLRQCVIPPDGETFTFWSPEVHFSSASR